MAAAQQADAPPPSTLVVDELTYHPAGAPSPLLNHVCMQLPPESLGVVFGRSGSGKTTLLACLSGLVQQTSGTIGFANSSIPRYTAWWVFLFVACIEQHTHSSAPPSLTTQERQQAMGMVFQFPERHFIGATLAQELTMGWPRGNPSDTYARQMVAANVLQAVGLMHIPLDTPLHTLSDGYKRYVKQTLLFIVGYMCSRLPSQARCVGGAAVSPATTAVVG